MVVAEPGNPSSETAGRYLPLVRLKPWGQSFSRDAVAANRASSVTKQAARFAFEHVLVTMTYTAKSDSRTSFIQGDLLEPLRSGVWKP